MGTLGDSYVFAGMEDTHSSGDQDLSTGCSSVHQQRAEAEPSCVSLKSDRSMDNSRTNFRSENTRPVLSSVHQRRAEAEPSCVSMKSDASMDRPIHFKSEHRRHVLSSRKRKRAEAEPSCVSMKSDASMIRPMNFKSEHTRPAVSVRSGSSVSSSVSMKSDWSMHQPPGLSGKTPSSAQSDEYELAASGDETHRRHKSFTGNLQWTFQNLENKMIRFLKNELVKFKKILQEENRQEFAKELNENRNIITEAALNLTLFFLREMKQDQAADTLEGELFFINQLKCSLKKKYQSVLEGVAQQGDSTLLNNIYTDLYRYGF